MLLQGFDFGTMVRQPYAEFANTYNASLYSPTTRLRSDRGSNSMAVRTSKEVWWKGFKDTFVIQSATSDPWHWRRIVFAVNNGPNSTGIPAGNYLPYIAPDIPDVPASTITPDPTNTANLAGVARTARKMYPLTVDQIQGFTGGLFKGTRGFDFDTGYGQLLTAAVDKENIRILSDKTRSITSGNDSGVMRKFKMYTPLNQKMVYADQESGTMLSNSSYAAPNSPLGDVYVFDLFVQLQGAPGSLTVSGQGTAYWHES